MLSNSIQEHKEFILEWNTLFPLDHWYRKKYNISFNSPQHRAISYIDMYYEWLEEKMFDKYLEQSGKENERIAEYQKTGKWLRSPEDDQDQEVLVQRFDNLDVSAFNDFDENENDPE